MNEEQGTAIDKEEFKGKSGEYTRWMEEIRLAKDVEKDWRKDVDIAVCTFRSDTKVRGNANADYDTLDSPNRAFNILWANVETKRPALYNSPPRPDIRRRHRDKDKLGRAISEVLERCVSYVVDNEDMDTVNKAAVNDMLLPGRAITRVKYISTMAPVEKEMLETDEVSKDENIETETVDEEVVDQQIRFDQVQWDAFNHGPGKCWDEVTWVSYEHRMTKDMVEEKWGEEIAKEISYNLSVDTTRTNNDDESDLDDTDETIFKRARIYEVWDKDERKVIWIAEGRTKGPISVDDDPLGLKNFFDIARPLYAIESSTSLIPITEYSQYIYLASDLEDITKRIRRIISACRVRGIYDSSLAELGKLFDSNDNEYVPAEDLSRLIENGGLEKAIWTIPIQQIAETLQILKQQRRDLVQEIYELTGISDIQRGSSNPHETKGAQEIKANFGSQRLKRQQEDVQRYLRDTIRIVVEIIAENFSRETLTAMSGISFPTNEEKAQAQQILVQAQQYQKLAQQQQQMAKQQPQGMPGGMPPGMMGPQLPPPPDKNLIKKAQQTMQKVTWEQIEETMSSDLTREYRIDVETDSTIQDELNQNQKDRTQLLTSIGQLLQTAQPAIQAGVMDQSVLKELLLDTCRSGKMGRGVEDAIENMQPPQKKGPSPEEQKAKMEMQVQQAESKRAQEAHQAEMQIKQIEAQTAKQNAQIEAQKLQQQAILDKREFDYKMMEMERKDLYAKREHERKMRETHEQERTHG
jgi:hypothetical protein